MKHLKILILILLFLTSAFNNLNASEELTISEVGANNSNEIPYETATITSGDGGNSNIIKRSEFSYLSNDKHWTSTSNDKSGLVYESLGYIEDYKDLAYYFNYLQFDRISSQTIGNINYNAKAKGNHFVLCNRNIN